MKMKIIQIKGIRNKFKIINRKYKKKKYFLITMNLKQKKLSIYKLHNNQLQICQNQSSKIKTNLSKKIKHLQNLRKNELY